MSISKVRVEEGCILFGLCEDICPEVFEMGTETTHIIKDSGFDDYEDKIR